MTTATQHDELRVAKGEMIFRQGDPGSEMFVISAGRVRLTIGTEGHEKDVALLGAGEFFGELSLLGDLPRSATAVAVEDSVLLVIARDAFAMMVQDDLDIVFRMMNIQGERLRRANQPIEELSQRLGRVRIAAHALRRVNAAVTFPFAFDVATLAGALGIKPSAVEATVADLAAQGAGVVQNGSWSFSSREPVNQLIAALCSYAEANNS